MDLCAFPAEIFDEILHWAIVARGVQRGLRLRLVNRLFSVEILQVLYSYRLLDDYLAKYGHKKRMPPFTAAYTAARVLNEPSNGKPLLIVVRKIAELLVNETSNTDNARDEDVRACIIRLCGLAYDRGSISDIFDPTSVELDERKFYECLLAAAAYTNSVSLFKRLVNDNRQYIRDKTFLGNAYQHIATGGNMDMVRMCPNKKMKLFEWIEYDPCLEIVQYMFQGGRENTLGWQKHFDRNCTLTDEGHEHYFNGRVLYGYQFVATTKLDVFNYMWNFFSTSNLLKNCPMSTRLLRRPPLRCCIRGCKTDMLQRLVELGVEVDNEDDWDRACYPLRIACKNGSTNAVQIIIKQGANPKRTWPCDCGSHSTGFTLEAAVGHHWDTVQTLLDHGAEISGPLMAIAAALGRLDILQMLIDRGVNVNAFWPAKPCIYGYYGSGSRHSLVTAISLERLDMFQFLLDNGAIMSEEIGRLCVEKAKENGLESMLEYLKQQGVNTGGKDVSLTASTGGSSEIDLQATFNKESVG